MNTKLRRPNRQETIFFAAVIGLFLMLGALHTFQTPLIAQLKQYDLWPKPEPLTELYFEDHTTLPTIVDSGAPIEFRFTIHNVEYKTVSYPYEIRLESPEVKEVLAKETITILHDGKITIPTRLETLVATRSAIVVDLLGRDQHIQFWVQPRNL